MYGAEDTYLTRVPDTHAPASTRRSSNVLDYRDILSNIALTYLNNMRVLKYISDTEKAQPRVSSFSGIPRPPQMPAHPMQVPEAK